MNFHSTLLLSISLAWAPFASATAQYPDLLDLDGKTHNLHANPLERFFEVYPDRRPENEITSSALWRGYRATFAVENAQLLVKELHIMGPWDPDSGRSEWRSVLNAVFPDTAGRTMPWFTGFLILPQGEMTHYVHMGYASRFEAYRVLFVRKGKVDADCVFTAAEFAEFKQLQFEAFKKTDRYKVMLEDLRRNHGADADFNIEYFLFIVDTNFPSETLVNYKDFRPNP